VTEAAVAGAILRVGVVLALAGRKAARRRRARLEATFADHRASPTGRGGRRADPAESPVVALVQGSLGLMGSAVSALLRGLEDRDDDPTVTILFGDVEDSTQRNVEMGDERWAEVLQTLHAVTKEVVGAHRGRVVKTQGDGFMVLLPRPTHGVRAAIDLREALASNPRIGAVLPLRLGLHCGEVVRGKGDVFGTEVVKAARIADRAKGGEVLLSHELAARLDEVGGIATDDLGRVKLKGLPGRHGLRRLRP